MIRPAWVTATAFLTNDGRPVFGVLPSSEADAGDVVYGHRDGFIYKSTDGWVTAEPRMLVGTVRCIHNLGAGTALVSIGSSVYHYDDTALSLTEVIAFPSGYAEVWNFTQVGDIVFVGEYGQKDQADNPRRIYKSTDRGESFTLACTLDNVNGAHVHKVLYDPATEVLWAAQGDPPNSKIFRVPGPNHDTPVLDEAGYQPTAGVVVGDYILWGKDGGTTGVLRYHKPTETYDQPLDLTGASTQSYILTMKVGSDGAVYTATAGVSGPHDSSASGVYWGVTPFGVGDWELLATIDPYTIREVVVAGPDRLVFRTDDRGYEARRRPLAGARALAARTLR